MGFLAFFTIFCIFFNKSDTLYVIMANKNLETSKPWNLSLRQNFVAAISRTNSNEFEFVRLIVATQLAALLHLVYTSGKK